MVVEKKKKVGEKKEKKKKDRSPVTKEVLQDDPITLGTGAGGAGLFVFY